MLCQVWYHECVLLSIIDFLMKRVVSMNYLMPGCVSKKTGSILQTIGWVVFANTPDNIERMDV